MGTEETGAAERAADSRLDERLARAGSRWRERNSEPAAVDLAAATDSPAGAYGGKAENGTAGAGTAGAGTAGADAGAPPVVLAVADTDALPLVAEPARGPRRRRTAAWATSGIGAAAAAAVIIVAVAMNGGNGSPGEHAQPLSDRSGATQLTGVDWRLVATSKGSVAAGVHATLRIGADGALSGNDGCNAMGGKAVIDGDTLTVSHLMHTMMGCLGGPVNVVSAAVDHVLDGPVRFEVGGDALVLTAPDGSTLTYAVSKPAVVSMAPGVLANSTWQLASVRLGNGIAQPDASVSSPPQGAWLAFADGTITGSDGCNSFVGKVDLAAGSITVERFTYPKPKPCPSSAEWTLVLQKATHWLIAGSQLTITDGQRGELRFTAKDVDPGFTGQTGSQGAYSSTLTITTDAPPAGESASAAPADRAPASATPADRAPASATPADRAPASATP